MHRRYHERGLSAVAFHPGVVATHFAVDSRSWLRHIYRLGRPLLTSPEKGASQLVWLARENPGTEWQSGGYHEKHRLARRNNPQTLEAGPATDLWNRTEALLAPGQ